MALFRRRFDVLRVVIAARNDDVTAPETPDEARIDLLERVLRDISRILARNILSGAVHIGVDLGRQHTRRPTYRLKHSSPHLRKQRYD